MKEKTNYPDVYLGVIGSADFCRRLSTSMATLASGVRTYSGGYSQAWGLVSAHRPNAILIEIGPHYSNRIHRQVHTFLEQLRLRYNNEIYVMIALLSPMHLSYGGDLLFAQEDSLQPSGFVDMFLVSPPPNMPSLPDLMDQCLHALRLYQCELQRRAANKPALPALNSEGWAHSIADPVSRELWMRWLPRYASYTSENPLIIGETGTGKTNLAYALHLLAGLPGKFVSITPRDFSSSELVQGELFGAVEGAYTGAVEKWGLVKSAEKGTLFIDELQSIDKDLQGKLITFIENKAYRRVGSSVSTEADVRFVFASNRALSDLIAANILREDFAYRLERMQLELLPLHQRRLDVPAALAYALAKIHRQRPYAEKIRGVSGLAFRQLISASWPGNLRQLENNVAKLCEISDIKGEDTISAETVAELFATRLPGTAVTANEILSLAAQRLSTEAMLGTAPSLQAGVSKLTELVRTCALEASAGDLQLAAELIGDDHKLMTLATEGILAHNARQRYT
ncbi:MAG: sigma-54-dependent Fis family transcriptional regulator [Deltaproteobacteria bacterium]|nr:sigma-54-dependent Fis family transcriptional regulator [Deltaproteobacteria bacterium]